ncbi:MAG: winged helix-turn-helix domain-containing protein [Pseudomonadota bacterium]
MNTLDKETMARLRQEREPQIAAAKERIKEQSRVLKLIKGHLAQGPDTVPGIARATGLSPRQALWYLMAMRKYGLAVEGDKQGGYFRYALSPSQTPPDPEAARQTS